MRLTARARDDDGQLSLLVLAYTLIAVCLVVVAVDITAVHIARSQLLDVADAAALDASDAVDASVVYGGGLEESVPLTDSSVQDAARSYVASYGQTHRLTEVVVDPGTGTPDGQSAVVVLTGHTRLPLLGPVVAAWSDGIDLRATSTARAELLP